MEKKEKEKEKIAQDDKGDVREVFVKLPTSYSPKSHTHTIAQLQRVPRESPEKCCAGQCSKPLLSTLAYVSWVSAKAEQGLLKLKRAFKESPFVSPELRSEQQVR